MLVLCLCPGCGGLHVSALGCQEGALRCCPVPPVQREDGCQLPGEVFLQGAEAALLGQGLEPCQRAAWLLEGSPAAGEDVRKVTGWQCRGRLLLPWCRNLRPADLMETFPLCISICNFSLTVNFPEEPVPQGCNCAPLGEGWDGGLAVGQV